MTPDTKIETQLDEDLAVQGTPDGGEPATVADGDKQGAKPEEEQEMEDAQKDAAEERKEGGYQ